MKEITARIHSRESAGAVDGPGLRYVIFFQGCPLRCKFCHNPDTWDTKGGEEVTVGELLKSIIEYKSFMKFSNGGVTASGGEPLLQKKFLIELFKLLKQEGIHTTIDTSGFVNIDDELDELLDLTDLVMLDIKHLDPQEHLELTGVENEKILRFLDHLRDKGVKTWIRWVVLAGLNDSEEYARGFRKFIKGDDDVNSEGVSEKFKREIEEIEQAFLGNICKERWDDDEFKKTIQGYDNVEKIELLPYHEMGKYKWEAMGMEYKLGEDMVPRKEVMDKINTILN